MEITSHKIFIFDKLTVYFKHSDYYGFVHPYYYFEWTSYVREAFFSQMCNDFRDILNSPIKMMTAKISSTMYSDNIFGEAIEARFTTSKIKKVSFDVIIRFWNRSSERLLCGTQHTLVFVDSLSQQFTSIPPSLKNAIVQYEEV